MRRSALMVFAAVVVVASGCGSDGESPGAAGDTSSTETSSSPAVPPSPQSSAPAIVGEWQRLQKCSEFERVMLKAGLRQALLESIATDGWIPGVSSVAQIKDPAHPCRGAVARKHSHFFTSDGYFGSRDANGEQVDDGTYRLVGDSTFVIGPVTFHYKIFDGGKSIMFTPEIPKCRPHCFEAGWSVAVAYPGYKWHRVP
jgi:hypothetical protein